MKASMIAPMMGPPISGNAMMRQQPAGDDGADDADDDVADQPEAAALDDHAGKPAGNRADDEPNDDALRSMIPPDSLPGEAAVARTGIAPPEP